MKYTAEDFQREAFALDNNPDFIGDGKTAAMLRQSAADRSALKALVESLREKGSDKHPSVPKQYRAALVHCADELAAIIGEQP